MPAADTVRAGETGRRQMNDTGNKPVWPGWRTMEVLGKGTYGAVYRIERELFGTKEEAALKVITIDEGYAYRSEGLDEEEVSDALKERMEQISREYLMMKKLNGHSNVVSCDDILMEQNPNGMSVDVLIKMELLTPLTDTLPKGEIPEETAIRLGKDMANALVLCAENNIIHRDIKPANIFLSPNKSYKLGDFGVARTMESTMSATRTGTFDYMSPEVFAGKPYGAGADIYSLGLVLYWMMNERRTPFLPLPPERPRMEDKETALMRRMGGEPLPEPKHGSPALKQIILKACAYRTEDRYQSAAELLSALEALERGERTVEKTSEKSAEVKPTAPAKEPEEMQTVKAPEPEQPTPLLKSEQPVKAPESAQPAAPAKTEEKPRSIEPKPKKRLRLLALIPLLLLGAYSIAYAVCGGWVRTEYDGAGNAIKETWYNYFGVMDCVRKYDSNGSVLNEHEYDSAGNLTKWTWYNADGSVHWWYEYEYDSAGNRTKWTRYNADGSVYVIEYDSAGKIKKETTYNSDGSIRHP